MTKQEIVELIKDNLQYECYNGFGISEYSINTTEIYDKADALLAKIEQEKQKAKLEQINACAEEWKSEVKRFEQEKKEIVERENRTMQRLLEVQKREIFRAVYEKLLGSGHSYLIKELAKEYGVEL